MNGPKSDDKNTRPPGTAGPLLSRAQVRAVDQRAVERLHIPSLILMENAGKNAADWLHARFGSPARRAVIFCGTGNNGGDGFVIARHLHNAGWHAEIMLVGDADHMTADAATHHAIAEAMGIAIRSLAGIDDIGAFVTSCLTTDDIVIDALLGTGFRGAVRDPQASVIAALNATSVYATIAVDVPSGLDCDSGEVGNVAIRADATITFVAAKTGFSRNQGPAQVGEVHVVDIGAPPTLIDEVLGS